MFMIAAETFIAECEALAPETAATARGTLDLAKSELDFVRLDAAAFEAAPSNSVGYAIFEKTTKAAVLPVSFVWSDLGSWDAVWSAHQADALGNVVLGPALLSNTTNAMVMTSGAHVVVDGLDDIAVIASDDAIFVGRLSLAQRVGALVKLLL